MRMRELIEIIENTGSRTPHRDPLFPDRPQGYGFATERQAIRAARDELGGKAKKGLAFITLTDNGTWGWLSADSHEYTKASIAASARAKAPIR